MAFRLPTLLGIALFLFLTQSLLAETFAIHTTVHSRGESEPSAEHVTIFTEGQILDFLLTSPERVTQFDSASRQFMLAMPGQKKKTNLSADELIQFAATEQGRAEASSSALIRFAAKPTFREQFDRDSGTLSLTSPHWDYLVQASRDASPEVLSRYGEFANWYTNLNALFRPIPPAVRLELNRVLDRHGCLPTQVRVRIKRDGDVLLEQESRHELILHLTQREEQLLARWKEAAPTCESVPLPQFLSLVNLRP